jgi:hypothetical protein
MTLIRTILLIAWLLSATIPYAQSSQQFPEQRITSLPGKYLANISAKARLLEQQLDKQSVKALAHMQKKEDRMRRKLFKIDSVKALELFSGSQQQYERLSQKIEKAGSVKFYTSSIDTLTTSLQFLKQNPELLSNIKQAKEKLGTAIQKVNGMDAQFQKAEAIKKFFKERQAFLKQQLQQAGLVKELKKWNKEAYYYSQQLNDYKTLLKDHKKAEKKAMEVLGKTKLFRDFLRKNSQLASLFNLPGNPADPTSQLNFAGLQTRTQVNAILQQQLAAGGQSAQQQFSQNLHQAQDQLNSWKNKLTQSGSSGSDDIMPEGFKPNNQKTKSFLQRLELGSSFQSQKANGYFPATTDMGLSIGYKLTDKNIMGIGASYKMGLGESIRHINITHQGIGLRSFIDWKIKGSFWMSGGYEMNYRNAFNRIDVLKDLDAWQQSGLIGLSKVISLKTKFFSKTKLQFLWDFMSYQQLPRTQPILFRVGYSIK